jgi:Spy/CpxP family protein refolding chaperone
MKPTRLPLLAALGLSLTLAGARAADRPAVKSGERVTAGQTQFTAALQKSKSKSTKTKKARKYRGRLPNYYGRIGLSDKQRKKIYSIQISYHEQILALEKQLKELRTKQSTEIEAVLTSDQKKKLNDQLEAARKKRAARKNKRKKSKSKATDK